MLGGRRDTTRSVAREVNFDGLVGPTYNYGGISFGNVASADHQGQGSNPRAAALQGLAKMRTLHDLGVPQALFPPHFRPELGLARRMGFTGTDAQVLQDVARALPLLLASCYSASSMWTANAATVSPSADSADGRVHFTPANLQNKIHRSIEWPTTARILKAVFEGDGFAHHQPLPSTAALGDEGAANHTRLAPSYGAAGVQLFVYGESAANPFGAKPKFFPARHTLEASTGVVRLHRLHEERVVMAQQNPEAIDAGVFHNDVISVGDRDVFLCHERAFLQQDETLRALSEAYARVSERPLRVHQVREAEVPLHTAVATYLFNSQLVALPEGKTALIAPEECQENASVRDYITALVEGDAPIDAVHYFDLRQSMQGGGGPACLRLRVVLTDEELAASNPRVVFSPALHHDLEAWVEKHYRDRLTPRDLADPQLLDASRVALDELTQRLELGSIYPFQLA